MNIFTGGAVQCAVSALADGHRDVVLDDARRLTGCCKHSLRDDPPRRDEPGCQRLHLMPVSAAITAYALFGIGVPPVGVMLAMRR